MLERILSNKRGFILGFVITFLLLADLIFSLRKHNITELEYLIIIGIVVGGMISGFVVESFITSKSKGIWKNVGAIGGSILISPLSLGYGIIIGVLGGSIGSIGGTFSIYLGISIVVSLMIIIIEIIGAIIGFALGSVLQKIVHWVGPIHH